MTIKEKLKLIQEIRRRNDERIKLFLEQQQRKTA